MRFLTNVEPCLRLVINCGPCDSFIAKCLRSVQVQSYKNWHAQVTVDPCLDRTYESVCEAAGSDDRFTVVRNSERLYSMANLVRGVEACEDLEDVVVILDGDDWFLRDDALAIIVKTYSDHDCWLTYGSWVSNVDTFPGLWPPYPASTSNYRSAPWLATAVRTWKKWLWDRIDPDDFRDENGDYFRLGEDVATMLPMLEMSGTSRARHIDVALMLYNAANPAGAVKTMNAELRRNASYLRTKEPYSRILDRVSP